MNAKNLILGLSVAAIGLSSCCNTSTKTNVSLKNEADTASFYIGYMYGSNITGNGIEDINMDAIIAGMNSALQTKDAPADMMQMNMFLQKYTQKAMMAKAEKALKELVEEGFIERHGVGRSTFYVKVSQKISFHAKYI